MAAPNFLADNVPTLLRQIMPWLPFRPFRSLDFSFPSGVPYVWSGFVVYPDYVVIPSDGRMSLNSDDIISFTTAVHRRQIQFLDSDGFPCVPSFSTLPAYTLSGSSAHWPGPAAFSFSPACVHLFILV